MNAVLFLIRNEDTRIFIVLVISEYSLETHMLQENMKGQIFAKKMREEITVSSHSLGHTYTLNPQKFAVLKPRIMDCKVYNWKIICLV